MSILGTYNSCVPAPTWGGYKCLLINNLHNYRGGFGFKTAASSCPDGMTCSGVTAFLQVNFSSNFYKPMFFSKTMKEIKNKELQERQTYVPASVKVIETSVQRVICTSPSPNEFNPYQDGWNI